MEQKSGMFENYETIYIYEIKQNLNCNFKFSPLTPMYLLQYYELRERRPAQMSYRLLLFFNGEIVSIMEYIFPVKTLAVTM